MEEETEILKSIYFDDIVKCELECDKPFLEITIYPSDTENEENKKSLRIDLITIFTKDYPNKVPEFKFKNVRGITDDDLAKIQNEIKEIAEKNVGNQMLFEIIQHIKDYLSNYGMPKSCHCAICLNSFSEEEKIINLDCSHYFHLFCLIKHLNYMEELIENERKEAEKNKLKWVKRVVQCPVCRRDMNENEILELHKTDINKLTNPLERVDDVIVISNKMRQMQIRMQTLFEKQKKAGGIIDHNEKPEIIVLTRPAQADSGQEANNSGSGFLLPSSSSVFNNI